MGFEGAASVDHSNEKLVEGLDTPSHILHFAGEVENVHGDKLKLAAELNGASSGFVDNTVDGTCLLVMNYKEKIPPSFVLDPSALR